MSNSIQLFLPCRS